MEPQMAADRQNGNCFFLPPRTRKARRNANGGSFFKDFAVAILCAVRVLRGRKKSIHEREP